MRTAFPADSQSELDGLDSAAESRWPADTQSALIKRTKLTLAVALAMTTAP